MTCTLLKPRIKLDVGDRVHWTDPDADCCSGEYRIQEILTRSGLIEDVDSVLVLCNDAGSVAEVFVREVI